jgi:hypothetical protein
MNALFWVLEHWSEAEARNGVLLLKFNRLCELFCVVLEQNGTIDSFHFQYLPVQVRTRTAYKIIDTDLKMNAMCFGTILLDVSMTYLLPTCSGTYLLCLFNILYTLRMNALFSNAGKLTDARCGSFCELLLF